MIAVLAFSSCHRGYAQEMSRFHVPDIKLNGTQSAAYCKELGYDGLAVLSSPEDYASAIRFTDAIR